jgi:putative MATE family efflux protein
MFVGNFLGKHDAAAVGASSILVTCLIGLFTGISVGTGVVTAQYWGAKKKDEVKVCIENSLVLCVAGGILLTVVGLFFSRQALTVLNTPDEIMDSALVYIRIYLLAILAMILYNMCAGILRALGDSRTPFLVLAVGGILNVAMDALFIAVLQWGIAGVAVATLISQTFTAVVLLIQILHREQLLKTRWNIQREMAVRILCIGFPLGIQSMVITLSNLVVQYFINGFGENAVAAFTVYFRAENLVEGLKIIRITFPLYFLYAILEVTGGIIRGIGRTLQSMFIVIATLCGARILLLNLFVHYNHSIRAVAAVYPATWALAAATFVIYYQYLNRQMIRQNA